MEIKKIKPTEKGETIPAIYFDGFYARYNAICRDIMGDPDYIHLDINGEVLTISPSTSKDDYKVSKGKKIRKFSSCALMKIFGKIAPKTKIFGNASNDKLVFILIGVSDA